MSAASATSTATRTEELQEYVRRLLRAAEMDPPPNCPQWHPIADEVRTLAPRVLAAMDCGENFDADLARLRELDWEARYYMEAAYPAQRFSIRRLTREIISRIRGLRRAWFRRRQSARGKKGAAARWQNNQSRETVDRIIATLARQQDELGDPLPPSDLWPELHAALDNAELNPREHDSPPRYECDGLPEPLTWEAFRRRIQRARS